MLKTNVVLRPMEPNDRKQFILDNQRSFRYGALQATNGSYGHFDENEEIITPPEIEEAMDDIGAETYRIYADSQIAGGVILKIDRKTRHNTLVLFFVIPEAEGHGVGYSAWCEIEKLHPETEVWDTCTPYFDRRNLHFYINKCGFHAVEFTNRYHPDPSEENPDEEDCMFLFEKVMNAHPAANPTGTATAPIETERLVLRPFRDDDAADLFSYLHRPTVNCFCNMTIESAEEAEAALKERMEDTSGLYVAIVLKETGRVIGEIFSGPEATDPTESTTDTYSPCWMLHPNQQKKGYMFEAVSAYYDFLFYKMNARRIYIYTEDYNIPCQRLCEKLGMRKEGEFKEFVSFVKKVNGEPLYENTMQYAILKKEWAQR